MHNNGRGPALPTLSGADWSPRGEGGPAEPRLPCTRPDERVCGGGEGGGFPGSAERSPRLHCGSRESPAEAALPVVACEGSSSSPAREEKGGGCCSPLGLPRGGEGMGRCSRGDLPAAPAGGDRKRRWPSGSGGAERSGGLSSRAPQFFPLLRKSPKPPHQPQLLTRPPFPIPCEATNQAINRGATIPLLSAQKCLPGWIFAASINFEMQSLWGKEILSSTRG